MIVVYKPYLTQR